MRENKKKLELNIYVERMTGSRKKLRKENKKTLCM